MTIVAGSLFVPEVTAQARFWVQVQVEKGSAFCWPWQGQTATGPLKYGKVGMRVDGAWHTVQAHRAAWALTRGRWPQDQIDHLCSNPTCVNPTHLEEVSRQENMTRMIERGRNHNQQKTHCSQGHIFDKTRLRSNGRTYRICSICTWQTEKNRRARKRLEQEAHHVG